MNYTAPNGTIYSIVDAPFAGGGEGDVFDIPGSFGMVAKIYSP